MVALLAVVGGGCTSVPSRDVVVIRQGELLIDPAPAPPPADRPGWETVALPDTWTIERRRVGTAGWYRFTFRTAIAPSELWGAYLPRVSMNAAVKPRAKLLERASRRLTAILRASAAHHGKHSTTSPACQAAIARMVELRVGRLAALGD